MRHRLISNKYSQRGARAKALYEPRSYAERREEERLIAEQDAQRLRQQAPIPSTQPNPPLPAGFAFQEPTQCSE